jgi:transposase
MMIVPAGVKVHLALGYTDMRKGMDGLAALVQEQLKRDRFSAICSPSAANGRRSCRCCS